MYLHYVDIKKQKKAINRHYKHNYTNKNGLNIESH